MIFLSTNLGEIIWEIYRSAADLFWTIVSWDYSLLTQNIPHTNVSVVKILAVVLGFKMLVSFLKTLGSLTGTISQKIGDFTLRRVLNFTFTWSTKLSMKAIRGIISFLDDHTEYYRYRVQYFFSELWYRTLFFLKNIYEK